MFLALNTNNAICKYHNCCLTSSTSLAIIIVNREECRADPWCSLTLNSSFSTPPVFWGAGKTNNTLCSMWNCLIIAVCVCCACVNTFILSFQANPAHALTMHEKHMVSFIFDLHQGRWRRGESTQKRLGADQVLDADGH